MWKLKESLSARRVFMDDASITSFLQVAESTVLEEGVKLDILFLQAPNFTSHPPPSSLDPQHMSVPRADYAGGMGRVLGLLAEVENSSYSVGQSPSVLSLLGSLIAPSLRPGLDELLGPGL